MANGNREKITIVVLGASGVGKTSLIEQFSKQRFTDCYSPTSQRSAYFVNVFINDRLYDVQIIDLPTLVNFPKDGAYEKNLKNLRDASAYILVFDCSSEKTFLYVSKIRKQIQQWSKTVRREAPPIAVVGNKYDVDGMSSALRKEYANLIRKQWKCGYYETSAKFNWHVVLVFKELFVQMDQNSNKNASVKLNGTFRTSKCTIL